MTKRKRYFDYIYQTEPCYIFFTGAHFCNLIPKEVHYFLRFYILLYLNYVDNIILFFFLDAEYDKNSRIAHLENFSYTVFNYKLQQLMQILVNIMFEGTHTFDNKRAIKLHSLTPPPPKERE